MHSSPPGTPEGIRSKRPQSMYSMPSPDAVLKQRPQSMMMRPPRSSSRLSQSSKQGASRTSDEDGKTSVKVVVRVRPPLGPSDPGYDLIPQRFQRSMVQVNTNTTLGVESPQGRKIFIFDRVFGEDTRQTRVWEYLQDSVDSFLQGYNVSILAYGQSGAGKSYTMGTSGPADQFDPSAKGVIPRAAQHLFDNLNGNANAHVSGIKSPTRYSVGNMHHLLQNSRQPTDKNWEMSVTYVEIYNEQPRDLLLPESTPLAERSSVQIREDPKGRIFVEGLKSVPVRSIEELMGVLNHGSTIRQTDATAINARSSRSHAVFTINLKQVKSATQMSPTRDKRASVPVEALGGGDATMTVESKLHFVDLAGSERLKNTGATGDRAKEGISINAGLASLGKVISQLSSRSSGTYVSYRDSKLTRMLQDSLGGNAITYMIACVTPAEFHLSETLNTVQYAQRARNIQSKPKIQQVNEDGDKQALIDRLRTEVAFLRQQIRSAEGGDRRPIDRSDRLNERENELQNQLLDVQESYTALSQRHAKLISELTNSGETSEQIQPIAESAVDRLKRSQAHQQQIEQVVLEYEKTIQSLEANLSTTRSSLATTESSLLERETKCAYIETMNLQLNSRIQKLMERETNTESYLHDLEARLADKSSGSEKNSAVISDLRKEISRIRESETNAEDYICTLEERLAEADQDMEIMQREVERLEHLVERQRSLGKLDNLLYELDHMQGKDTASSNKLVPQPLQNGVHHEDENESESALKEAKALELPADSEEDFHDETAAPKVAPETPEIGTESDDEGLKQLQEASTPAPLKIEHTLDPSLPSPAQTKYVADKFESVSQELFDLRLEHESTVNELDLLSAKYQEALRTLAEMQDSFDEARHGERHQKTESSGFASRPTSFLEETTNPDMGDGEHMSSSRSLSSELSLAGESPISTETEITPMSKDPLSSEVAAQEIERLQNLLAEHERGMNAVTEQYSQLQAEHKDTLSTVDRLKTEVQRNRPQSPSAMPGMLRRMTSQIGTGVDRGQRSIVSLRSLLAEEFDDKPDRMENAEVHLSAATHELQTRMERVQALEAEVKNIKREMEMKSTIISGLTRERNSIKVGSPVDLSMVSQLRDQLISKETELKSLHEGYARREQDLHNEIQKIQSESRQVSSPTPAGDQQIHIDEHHEKVRSLENQINDLSTKHESAQQAADESERSLSNTKAELVAALASVETMKAQHARGEVDVNDDSANAAMQQERDNYQQLIDGLKKDLEIERSANIDQSKNIDEHKATLSAVSKELDNHVDLLKARQAEVTELKAKVVQLEHEVAEAQSAVAFHKHGLKSLHEAHRNDIEEMKLSHAGILASYDDQMAEMTLAHDKAVGVHKAELEQTKTTLQKLVDSAQGALGHPTSHDMLASHIQDLAEEKRHVTEANSRLTGMNAELERQLNGRQSEQELEEQIAAANVKITNYQETIRNLANEIGTHEDTIREKSAAIKKHETTIENMSIEKKQKSALIEELEQQLQNSYDQHHNRVSVIQAQGNQALVEAQQRIVILEKDLEQRRSLNDSESGSRTNTMKSQHRPQSPQMDAQARSNSMTSNLRKSASIASLPSPPPAIPLPPLPTLPGLATAPVSNPSPPQSRHTSKEVNLPINAANATNSARVSRQSALLEEQEGRIKVMEKHLHAEKQLTATLEEALVDLETQSNKLRADAEVWKKKAWAMEEELSGLRKERKSERLSLQAVEEEVKKRREAEAARAQLEERMRLLTVGKDGKQKKKKGGGLNCF